MPKLIHGLPKEQRNYAKGVVCISLAIAGVILLSAVVYTAIFQRMTRTRVEALVCGNLRENAQRVESMTDYVKDLLPQIYYDTTVSRLIDYDEISVSEYMKGYYQLNRYRLICEPVESIYLYNASRRMFFVSSDLYRDSEQPADSFCDQDILAQLERPIRGSAWMPIARTVPVELTQKNNGEDSMQVITFLYSVAPTGTYQEHNAVIVNFSQSMLRSNIALLSGEEDVGEIVLIAGQEGGLVFTTSNDFSPEEPLSAHLDKAGAEYVQSSEEDEGVVCRVDGEKFYMTKRRMPGLGWTIFSLMPYSYVDRETAVALRLSACLGAGVVAVGAALAAFLSYKFYREMGEKEKERLAHDSRRQRARYRQELLRSLLLGRMGSLSELEADLVEYEIPFSPSGCFHLIIARIDRYQLWQQSMEPAEVDRRRDEILLYCTEKSEGKTEGVRLSGSELAWIYQGSQSPGELLKAWSAYVPEIRERWGCSMSLIVSGGIENLLSLPYAYRQTSEELFLKRHFLGYGTLTLATGIDHSPQAFPEKERAMLMNALKAGDIPGAKECYQLFVQKASAADLNYFNLAMTQLSTYIDSFITTIQEHHSVAICSNAFGMDVSREAIETQEDIDRLFYEVFDSLGKALDGRTLQKQKKTLDHARDIIEQQCADPNFTTKTLTDALQISYASLNKAFQAYLSVSLSNYLLRVRIERAQTMLVSTDEPIAVIAEQSGFANHIYFHRVFKKQLGVPPGEYRKQAIAKRNGR